MDSRNNTIQTAGLQYQLKISRYCFVLIVAACLILVHPLVAAEGIKGNLVDVNWLEKNLKNPNVLILDASPAKLYAVQHIPGAINVDFMRYGITKITTAEMEQRLQSWGVSPGKKIVIYDAGGAMMATRLFYDLYYNGFPAKNIFILDGGLYIWQKSGGQITKEPSAAHEKGTFRITKFNEDARVKLPEIITATGDTKNYALLEALDASWHFGELQFFGRPGHIPNGILLPSTDFYNPDKTFKSVEEIKKMLDYLGVNSEQEVYTYCGGGIAASVPFFALKFILKFPKVKLYSESEMGWVKDERGLPYWTYDTPFLVREPNWLNTWGGKIMRMYGVSEVSIIDIRKEGEFHEGHIPFAINIPADVFERNFANPIKLAEILGQSGVNATDEAVLVSGAGLTKESALAFVMLEKLGQKKVSLFVDSMDKWAKLGYSVIKDTAVVAPKKVTGNFSLPAAYPGNLRNDVIITDPNTTQGFYTKVFIASGNNVPAKIQDGKVVHVPYTDLLNADGTPKAAKDIWNILVKAGVPRYAEIVCFSADPGEAAANYFILKLMGYPDIKVLMN